MKERENREFSIRQTVLLRNAINRYLYIFYICYCKEFFGFGRSWTPEEAGKETMARPRLGDAERRRRTIGVRVDGSRGSRTAGASPSRAPLHGSLTCAAGRWVSGCGARLSGGWERRKLRELNRIGVNLNQMAAGGGAVGRALTGFLPSS